MTSSSTLFSQNAEIARGINDAAMPRRPFTPHAQVMAVLEASDLKPVCSAEFFRYLPQTEKYRAP
jgi:hypothetical protein